MVASATLWILWMVLQCSAVALVALGILLTMHHVRPDTRGRIAMVGLACMSLLVIAGLIPGEGWIRAAADASPGNRVMNPENGAAPPVEQPEGTATTPTRPKPTDQEPAEEAVVAAQWQRWTGWFVAPPNELPADDLPNLRSPASPPVSSIPWLGVIALALLAAELLALARIVGGFWAIQRLVARSSPSTAHELQSRLAELCDSSGIRANIDLRISHEVQTPAVVGWRHFTVLLPPEYRDWSAAECDAVLAHELAHVARRDGWWRAAATLLHALHFYNPLAYLLARRYCLEQELAADQLACEWLGERESYLQSLGSLALRRTSPTPAWPTLAFLPSRSMFVRRLEMLRHAPPLVPLALERAIQAGALFALIVAALVLGGLRPLEAQPPQTPPGDNAAVAVAGDTWLGAYVPNDMAQMMIEIDMAALMESPKIAELLARQAQENDPQNMSITDLVQQQMTLMPPDQVKSVLGVNVERRGESAQALMLVQSKRPVMMIADAQRLEAPNLAIGELYQLRSHFILVLGPQLWAHSNERERLEQLAEYVAHRPAQRPSLNTAFKSTESPVRFSVNWMALRPIVMAEESLANDPIVQMFSPLVETSQRWTLELSDNDDDSSSVAKLKVKFSSEAAAQTSQDTLLSLRTLLKNLLRNVEKQGPPTPETKAILDLAGELLESAQTEVSGPDVLITASTENSLEHIVTQMLPALQASRMAAQRMQDMNNAKQIGLAFWNYHDTYGHFPKAVVIDSESGEKRSWRIELLPFLGYQALYDQYRKDEPWDSEANRKVLAQMPEVYGSATSSGGTNSTFFVVTGEGTVLSPSQKPLTDILSLPEGVERPQSIGDNPTFYDITDGTSNTVLILQTSKDIPWTKAEDIPLEEANTAKLGGFHPGGFLAGFADGSVRFVSNHLEAETWKYLLLRDDGQVIPN